MQLYKKKTYGRQIPLTLILYIVLKYIAQKYATHVFILAERFFFVSIFKVTLLI